MTLNRVRMPIEATVNFRQESTGTELCYALGAECRTEQVWVERDVWHDPNASMFLIGGERHCLIEKRWARADFEATLHPPKLGVQPERQLIDPFDAFVDFQIDRRLAPARELNSLDAILASLSAADSVVCRTTYKACGYHITLEYPVKTVNFSEREGYYQVDTGPILFPGLDFNQHPGQPPLAACRSAFVAHNSADWAEFLVCVPTPLRDDLRVHHYSQVVRIEGLSNRLYQLLDERDLPQ